MALDNTGCQDWTESAAGHCYCQAIAANVALSGSSSNPQFVLEAKGLSALLIIGFLSLDSYRANSP